MRTKSSAIRAFTLMPLALLASALCKADVVFETVPQSGAITVTPLETVGWGYSIQNLTGDYLLPIGLANSGLLYGSLTDIFDYPVVDPGQTAYQSYSFNSPGGFGNSLGLFEYSAPADLPVGLDQTGMFTLTYQFYDANPDLNAGASPIGGSENITANFDVAAIATPEPSTLPLTLAIAAIILARGMKHLIDEAVLKITRARA